MHEVTTAEELDALPIGSVVLDAFQCAWQKTRDGDWQAGLWRATWDSMTGVYSENLSKNIAPLTVLFRPDAPQPTATGNSAFPVADARRRAARALITERDDAEEWADRLAAALAPADVIGEHSSANNPWQNALDYAEHRSDATTPTEVEWGVRESNGVETHYGSGTTAEVAARRILAIADGFTLIQRTVSAWREVEGGEQRG